MFLDDQTGAKILIFEYVAPFSLSFCGRDEMRRGFQHEGKSYVRKKEENMCAEEEGVEKGKRLNKLFFFI